MACPWRTINGILGVIPLPGLGAHSPACHEHPVGFPLMRLKQDAVGCPGGSLPMALGQMGILSLPRPRFKLRVHLFKTFDDSRSLSSSQGTDRIDQLAARFECPCTCLKAFKLQGCQFLNVLGLGGPPCIGMPLPSAKTAARGVDQDAIKASFEGCLLYTSPSPRDRG